MELRGRNTVDAANDIQQLALFSILNERIRQEKKWGEQNHDPMGYLSILLEEVGEFAMAANQARWGGPAAEGLRKEACHVAAVALAIVEMLDRNKWEWSVDLQSGAVLQPGQAEILHRVQARLMCRPRVVEVDEEKEWADVHPQDLINDGIFEYRLPIVKEGK